LRSNDLISSKLKKYDLGLLSSRLQNTVLNQSVPICAWRTAEVVRLAQRKTKQFPLRNLEITEEFREQCRDHKSHWMVLVRDCLGQN